MGDRRMFSKKVVQTAGFLKMPATSQLLYFFLGLNADDDGIVDAYPVMRMCKANEDDFRVLVSKAFVTPLNEDLVTYINDWREQNTLRPDRKTDSRYLPLLRQVRPEIQILEKKKRTDTGSRKPKTGPSTDGQRTAQDKSSQENLTESNLTEDQSISLSYANGMVDREMEREMQNTAYKKGIARRICLSSLREEAVSHGEAELAMVNEIYDTICDMVCNPRKQGIVIQNVLRPWENVKEQFLKLTYQHVANLLHRLLDKDLGIRNMHAYLISALYVESMSGTLSAEAEIMDEYLKPMRENYYLK